MRKQGFSADIDPEVKGFKSQFKRAEREKSRYVVIIGEDELASGSATVKSQKTGAQEKVPFDRIADFLKK